MSKPTLYHYSKERYPKLLTLEQQRDIDPTMKEDAIAAAKFRGDLFPYYQHVSFFLDPVPLDIIGDIYPKDHRAWVNGNELCEYEVDPRTLPIKGWMLTEAPLQTFLFDVLPWFENDLYKKGYFKAFKIGRILTQSEGTDVASLLRCIEKYKGRTRAAYERVSKRKDWDDIKHMYAATVPHLMVYTDVPLPYRNVRQVTVGGSPTLESHPPSAEW